LVSITSAQTPAKDQTTDQDHEERGHDHAKEEKESGDEHGHGHEEESNNIGPNKGVTAANESMGFVLKEKVESNFSIQKQKLTDKGPFAVPTKALLHSGLEKQVFRYRDKYWKAVDVKIIKKEAKTSTIASKDLAAGDSIAVTGVGFLKIIEQSVFGPAIEGHVH
jgi:hypothetical protein